MYFMGAGRMSRAGTRSETEGGDSVDFAPGCDDCVTSGFEEAPSHCKYAISDQCRNGGTVRTGGSCNNPEYGVL